MTGVGGWQELQGGQKTGRGPPEEGPRDPTPWHSFTQLFIERYVVPVQGGVVGLRGNGLQVGRTRWALAPSWRQTQGGAR